MQKLEMVVAKVDIYVMNFPPKTKKKKKNRLPKDKTQKSVEFNNITK